jgi:hypothetical protein
MPGQNARQANSWKEAQMLHPALSQALATAHIEDLHRVAAQRQTIRLARRVAQAPHIVASPIAIVRSASTGLRGRRAPQADGTATEIPTWESEIAAALEPPQ